MQAGADPTPAASMAVCVALEMWSRARVSSFRRCCICSSIVRAPFCITSRSRKTLKPASQITSEYMAVRIVRTQLKGADRCLFICASDGPPYTLH